MAQYKLKDLVRTHTRSYKYAARGLLSIFLQQLNFKLELIISITVIVTSFILQISLIEFTVIIFTISLVLVAEALNQRLRQYVMLLKNKIIKK